MKIFHAADLHLGSTCSAFGGLAPSRPGEVLEAFRRVPDIVAEERVDAILFAGDLFDGPKPATEAMAAVRETLRRLVDLCIPVFMVPGTHDATTLRLDPYRELARGPRIVAQTGEERPGRPWPVVDERGRELVAKHSVYILAAPRFGEPVYVQTDSGPLYVYGIAYDPAECRDPLATFHRADGRGIHVALFHAAIDDDPGDDGPGDDDTTAEPGGASSLVTTRSALRELDVDYIALGGDHRHRTLGDLDDIPACYPGAFAACDVTESGPRGYVLADVDADGPPRIEHRSAGVAEVATVELDVTGCIDQDAIAASLSERVPDGMLPAVRLTGEPSFPLDEDAVAAVLAERFGHAHVTDDTRYYASGRLDELAGLDTVAGHVVRLGRQRIEAADGDEARVIAQHALRTALRALEVR